MKKTYNRNPNFALLLQGVFVISLFISGCEKPVQPLHINGTAMGTTFSVSYFENDRIKISQKQIQIGIYSLLAEINRQMSTFDPESEISRFNSWTGSGEFLISNHFRIVVERSLSWQTITGGAFDISVLPLVSLWGFGPGRWKKSGEWSPPAQQEIDKAMSWVGSNMITLSQTGLTKMSSETQVDLSAIAKGYAVDQVSEYLKQHRIADFLVEIGGEVIARGTKPDGSPWTIGIDHPEMSMGKREILDERVQLLNNALGTSGNYRNFQVFKGMQYSHLLDPRTGNPVDNNVASVSVITQNCMDADALATALIIMGYEEGRSLVESLSGYEAIWVLKTKDGFESRISDGIKFESENIYAAGSSD